MSDLCKRGHARTPENLYSGGKRREGLGYGKPRVVAGVPGEGDGVSESSTEAGRALLAEVRRLYGLEPGQQHGSGVGLMYVDYLVEALPAIEDEAVKPWREALATVYDHERNRHNHGLMDGCYEAARDLLLIGAE